jgi:hypothetical protein
MEKIKVIKVICGHCQVVLRDIPEELKSDPDVIVEISHGICRAFYKEQLEELDKMGKHLESRLKEKEDNQ